MSLSSNTLLTHMFPSLTKSSVLKSVALAMLGSVLLTLSAKIQIPLAPVKISMQSFVVILLGCMYGSRLALATVMLYLAEGALGLPVFQGTPDRGIGLAYMVGPTGGYLVGFALAAYSVGKAAELGFGRTVISAGLLFILGAILIDIPGVLWLALLAGQKVAVSVFLSYQPAFILKTALGATLVPALWHLGPRFFGSDQTK